MHVLKCTDARAQEQWNLTIREFRMWLEQKRTDPIIITQLCSGLSKWRSQEQVPISSEDDALTIQQNLLGWNAVLEGCFHVSWAVAQQQYLNSLNSRQSGQKWQVAVCRRIWKIPWDTSETWNIIIYYNYIFLN